MLTRLGGALVAVLTALLFVLPSFARADFGIEPGSFEAALSTTQAGAHPDFTTSFRFNTLPNGSSEGSVKEIEVDLPVGLVGNTQNASRCRFSSLTLESIINGRFCARTAMVGIAEIELWQGEPQMKVLPVFNMVPEAGEPAAFAFNYGGVGLVRIDTTVRSDGDYGIRINVHDVNQGFPLISSKVTLWGVPAEHNGPGPFEFTPGTVGFNFGETFGEQGDGALDPLMRNGTRCGLPTPAELTVSSWQDPGQSLSYQSEPIAFTGCEMLSFKPSLRLEPASDRAGEPSGFEARLHLPQTEHRDLPATADLKDAVVRLPEGVAISAPQAEGLQGCTNSQAAIGSMARPACPSASKIGSAEIETALLADPLEGGIFLGRPLSDDPGSGQKYRIFLTAAGNGVVVKIEGRLFPDPRTGRLTAVFTDAPQLPFEDLRLIFKDGPQAPLTTPGTCGTYTTEAEFRPWAGGPPVRNESTFTIDQNCGASEQFTPGFEAGSTHPVAGGFSPFTLRVTKPSGQQNLSTIEGTLPEGLLAKTKEVPLCDEAAAAAAACSHSSQVGKVTVGVGSGTGLLYIPQAGKQPTALYLAGPYRGSPYSLVAEVPAQAGPFDLGTVVLRTALHVDPVTARVTAKSDPLPQVLQGVPIAYRDLRVDLNRPDFTVNPTSCNPMAITAQITGSAGAVATPGERFQVANCERLAFEPKLSLRLKGATRRSGHPQLTAVLTQKPGGSNIARVLVAMPRSEFLAQDHIRTVCTRVQFAAGACPKGSIYGRARAFSPLLDRPLEGPVYLRSSNNPLPDLVADLRGQIEIELVGRIDSKNGGIRTTFDTVPDAPVTKFVLRMGGGKKSLLENSVNLCASKNRATVKMDAHNGKLRDFRPLVRANCGSAGRR
ncbi:MAG TPA: hypothetical protein VD761_05755 [Solirubrobacterales bacterium]|nr:hypothetical protein [Solirubrobacterales bacterium]